MKISNIVKVAFLSSLLVLGGCNKTIAVITAAAGGALACNKEGKGAMLGCAFAAGVAAYIVITKFYPENGSQGASEAPAQKIAKKKNGCLRVNARSFDIYKSGISRRDLATIKAKLKGYKRLDVFSQNEKAAINILVRLDQNMAFIGGASAGSASGKCFEIGDVSVSSPTAIVVVYN